MKAWLPGRAAGQAKGGHNMKRLLSTTTLATVLAVGAYGLAGAQAVNPGQPGSASGGIQAQQGQPGTQPGSMTQSGANQRTGAATGGSMGQAGSTTMGQSGGTAAQAGQASRMSEEQVRSALRASGYSDIEDLERDGDNFKVGEAKRYGEEVKDLRVDARTGQVRDEGRLSEDQAKNLLRDRGYSDVSDVSRDGDTIRAEAKQGDREVRVRIDARTGTVTQQQASN
jgi:hypothetical protein